MKVVEKKKGDEEWFGKQQAFSDDRATTWRILPTTRHAGPQSNRSPKPSIPAQLPLAPDVPPEPQHQPQPVKDFFSGPIRITGSRGFSGQFIRVYHTMYSSLSPNHLLVIPTTHTAEIALIYDARGAHPEHALAPSMTQQSRYIAQASYSHPSRALSSSSGGAGCRIL